MSLPFDFHEEWRIPCRPGNAVERGWPAATGQRPWGVTWHWTATWDLAACRAYLGGSSPLRRGVASAHYGIGRSFAEGVDRYVSLEDRSWHAGKHQTLRWDGQAFRGPRDKGARTTIGVETVHIGYARENVPAATDWLVADAPNGRRRLRVQPWSDEQIEMMIVVGKEIVARWPAIGPRDHHGHLDLCAGYKVDPAGFPFARVLRRIYDDPSLPDVWSPLWTVRGRRRALRALGYLRRAGDSWGRTSAAALRSFQRYHGLVVDGMWTVFVSWKVWEALAARGLDLGEVAGFRGP